MGRDTRFNRLTLAICNIHIASLYTVFAYIVVTRDILYVSIPSFFVAILCILLYVYQWKRYKVMMLIQHKIRVKFPLIHKILFLGSLDPIILKLMAPGLFALTMGFIIYFFAVVIVLFFISAFENLSLTTEYGDAYVIPMVLTFLLLAYWLNKIILALAFWLIVLLLLLIIWVISSLIYLWYAKKRIEQEQEEQRRRNIEERYRDEESARPSNAQEESKQEESSDSSSSESSNVLGRLIQSMKKTFIIKHMHDKQSTSCPIWFETFKENETVIELKWDDKHTFHEACFHSWARRNDTCPLCRKQIEPSNET